MIKSRMCQTSAEENKKSQKGTNLMPEEKCTLRRNGKICANDKNSQGEESAAAGGSGQVKGKAGSFASGESTAEDSHSQLGDTKPVAEETIANGEASTTERLKTPSGVDNAADTGFQRTINETPPAKKKKLTRGKETTDKVQKDSKRETQDQSTSRSSSPEPGQKRRRSGSRSSSEKNS